MQINDFITNQNITVALTGEQLNGFASEILNGARAIYEKKEQQQSDRLVTIKEASERLNVSETTIWRYSRQGYLTQIKVGGKRFFRLSQILEKGGNA